MPLQPRTIAASLRVPEPNHSIKASTGHRAPVRAPGHRMDPVCMPLKRVETASTDQVPESDRPIPTRAGQSAAVGGKGQSLHPVAMPGERLHAGGWLCCLEFPYLNTSIKVATGQVSAVATPGHRIHGDLGSDRLDVGAGCRIPEPYGRIIPATGEHLAIGGKGQIFDDVSLPSCPQQRTTLYIPQFDRPIPASRGQQPFVRAESQGSLHCVGMRLPDQMQGLASLAPHPHFSPRAARRPKHSPGADGHRPGGTEGLGKDALTDQRCGQ